MQALKHIAAALIGLVLFAAAFIFTSLILAVAAVVALMLWGWIMWRTRHARRAAGRAAERGENVVIEGEYIVERDEHRQGADPKDPRG